MGFFYFLVALWTTYFCVVGRNAPPVHGKLEKNLKFHGWAVPVLFDGLSLISPRFNGGETRSEASSDAQPTPCVVPNLTHPISTLPQSDKYKRRKKESPTERDK
jgi:hypothetical protein